MHEHDAKLIPPRIKQNSHRFGARDSSRASGMTTQPMPHDPLADHSSAPGARDGIAHQGGWFNEVPGSAMRVRVSGQATNNALTVVESIVLPGSATPLHHHAVDEVLLILAGSLRLVRGGSEQDLGAGSSVVIPRGTHHGFTNLSEEPVRLYAVFTPGGMENLFLELARTPPELWDDLARRFDTVIVGPLVTD